MSHSILQISTDPTRLDIARVQQFLATTYWANGRSRDIVERSIRGSVCFGGYLDSNQVAFGRIVTDSALFAYFADIFVLPEWQGRGYGRTITQAMIDYADGCGVQVTMLGTRHAAGLYEKFGFKHIAPGATTMMVRARRHGQNAV